MCVCVCARLRGAPHVDAAAPARAAPHRSRRVLAGADLPPLLPEQSPRLPADVPAYVI
jgi:hypothetical protein